MRRDARSTKGDARRARACEEAFVLAVRVDRGSRDSVERYGASAVRRVARTIGSAGGCMRATAGSSGGTAPSQGTRRHCASRPALTRAIHRRRRTRRTSATSASASGTVVIACSDSASGASVDAPGRDDRAREKRQREPGGCGDDRLIGALVRGPGDEAALDQHEDQRVGPLDARPHQVHGEEREARLRQLRRKRSGDAK